MLIISALGGLRQETVRPDTKDHHVIKQAKATWNGIPVKLSTPFLVPSSAAAPLVSLSLGFMF